MRQVAWFVGLNMAVVALVAVPFVARWAPSEVLAGLGPVVQWSVAGVALLVHRVWGSGSFREVVALRRGRDLGQGLLLALVVVLLVPLVHLAVGMGLGLVDWEPRPEAVGLVPPVVVLAVVQGIFAMGEELGWRGFLHTHLRRLGGFWGTVLVTGLVWGLWHVPVAIDLALGGDLPPRMAVAYVLDIVPWVVVLGVLRERFDSVWPAVLAHGLINSWRVFALQNLTTAEDSLNDVQYWSFHAVGWVSWLVAGWLLWVWARRRGGVEDRI